MKIVFKSIFFCMASLIALGLNFSATPLSAAWNPSVVVSDPTVGGVQRPDGSVLTVNASNNGIGVYAANSLIFPNNSFAKNIYAVSYTFGSGWGPPVIISDPSIIVVGGRPGPLYRSQADPDIRMNASGYAIAAWEAYLSDSVGNQMEGIFTATRSSDGTWSSVQRASSFNTDFTFRNQNPAVSVNDSGLGVVVWNQQLHNTYYKMASFLPLGGIWTTPVQLDFLDNYGDLNETPDVEINANGNVVATWTIGGNAATYAVRASTYDPLTSLWTTVTLDPNPVILSKPITGIDDNGNAVVVWDRHVGSDYEIVSASFTNGTGWGAPVVIDQRTFPDIVDGPYVVMDRFGTSTAMWNSYVSGNFQVLSSTLPLDGSWSVPTEISSGGEIDPQLNLKTADVDDLGNVIVIIQIVDGLQSAVRLAQGGWQPPENISISFPRGRYGNIGIGSCGFALALWTQPVLNSNITNVMASDNFGILLTPPTNFMGSRCCQKFATQTRCVFRLTWNADPCAAFYVIRRNGVVISTIPAEGNTTFVDPVCSKIQRFNYTLSTINIYGVESQGISITVQ